MTFSMPNLKLRHTYNHTQALARWSYNSWHQMNGKWALEAAFAQNPTMPYIMHVVACNHKEVLPTSLLNVQNIHHLLYTIFLKLTVVT